MIRTESKCERFDTCSAPICPLKPNADYIWYPDEEICNLREFTALDWIKNQRKIAKKVRNKDFYFTQEMLERNCVITVATEGLDPDRTKINDTHAVNQWLKSHKEKRHVSESERENSRKRMLEYKSSLPLSENSQKRQENDKKPLVLDDIKSLISAR